MSIELQNAYETSQAERRAAQAENGNVALIAEHLDRGRFVLVAEVEAYCPRTDAIMGYDRIFKSAHDTHGEAADAIDALEAQSPGIAEVLRVVAPPVYGCEPRREPAPF